MADNPRQGLYLEISRNLVDEELKDLRNYVSGAKTLPAGFVQNANAHQICNQLEKEQKLKPGDLSLLADLLRKIGRHDYAEQAEKIAEDERKVSAGRESKDYVPAKRPRKDELNNLAPNPVLPARLQLSLLQREIPEWVLSRIQELERKLITVDILMDPERFSEAKQALREYKAFLMDLASGSVILFLTFLCQKDLDGFYQDHDKVGAGTLSHKLSTILIPSKTQDEFEGAQLTVKLQVKHEDYVQVRKRLGQAHGSPQPSTSQLERKQNPEEQFAVRKTQAAGTEKGLAVGGPVPVGAAGTQSSSLTDMFQKSVKNYNELKLSHIKPLIWKDNFTLDLHDIFTQIELVPTRGKQVKGPKEYLSSGERKELTSLDDLFKPDATGLSTAPRCILIEGEPGVGKTTFLSKEALDAVSQRTELGRRYDIVLLIRLREVMEGETIEEMVWDQCVPERKGLNVESIETILEKNESRVLFLLDGYDELRPKARAAGQAIPKLLSGKMYPNSTIVITSRPSAGVQQYTKPDCNVHIIGFSPEHVEIYVRRYFSMTEKPELGEMLLTVLNQSPLLTDLLHNPISLMFVCVLWEEDQEIISTGEISGLYSYFLTFLVRKYCEREEVDMPTEGLPTEVAESLLQLGKLTLQSLLRNETLLDLTEVEKEKLNLELLLKLGVVSLEDSSSKLHPRKQLNYSHKMMQEFLAGRYAAHALLGQDIVELLQLTSITRALEFSNLLLFTCGCDSRAAQAVMEELSKLSNKEFTHLQPEQFESSNVSMDQDTQKWWKTYQSFAYLCLTILSERQEPEVIQGISQALPIVMLDSSVDSREAMALKYYIQNLPSAILPQRLILKIHGSTDRRDTVQYLQQCFTTSLPGLKLDLKLSGQFDSPKQTARLVSVLKNVPCLRALQLSETDLTPSSLLPLVQGFSHMSLLEELDLSGNPELHNAGMNVLQVGLSSVPNLAVLRLRAVGMTAVGMSSLAPHMCHLARLREVDISGNMLGDTGMECLADMIKYPRAMKVLNLGFTGVSGKGIVPLLKVLPHLSKLMVLDVRLNKIGDSEIITLVQTLCQPSSLDTEQDPSGDKSETTAPHYNSTLRQLNIGWNRGVTGAGLGRVAQLISTLPALIWLDMCGHWDKPAHLPDTAAMDLAKALPRIPVLEWLDLRDISMEPAGFQAVVQAAEEHPTLERLHYTKSLVPEGADTTASCLQLSSL